MKQKPFVQLIPDQLCKCSAVSSQDETQFLLIFTGLHFSFPLDLSLTALSRDNISFHLCFFHILWRSADGCSVIISEVKHNGFISSKHIRYKREVILIHCLVYKRQHVNVSYILQDYGKNWNFKIIYSLESTEFGQIHSGKLQKLKVNG